MALPTGTRNITIVQGKRFELRFRILLDGVPVNFTGHEAKAQIVSKEGQGDVVATASSGAGITLSSSADPNSPDSYIVVVWDALETATIDPLSDGLFDIDIWPTGQLALAEKPLRGSATILRRATRHA